MDSEQDGEERKRRHEIRHIIRLETFTLKDSKDSKLHETEGKEGKEGEEGRREENQDVASNALIFRDFENLEKDLARKKDEFGSIPAVERAEIARLSNVYHSLTRYVSSKFHAEGVSNAWFKFYEILFSSDLPFPSDEPLQVFFNAELPGSFITCMNHYFHSFLASRTTGWDWLACSLNEGLSDRFGLLRLYPDKWLQNDSMNGDVTNPANLIVMKQRIFDKFPKGVVLYTSDGGTDVDKDPNQQESLTSSLFLGQALLGLSIIRSGGHFVLKQFTFFHKFTQSMLALFVDHFATVEIMKPEMSKRGNSETYVKCVNYVGFDSLQAQPMIQYLSQLHLRCSQTKCLPTQLKNPVIWKLRVSFIKCLYNICLALTKSQMEALDLYLHLAKRGKDTEEPGNHDRDMDRKVFRSLSYSITRNYTETFRFLPLPSKHALLAW